VFPSLTCVPRLGKHENHFSFIVCSLKLFKQIQKKLLQCKLKEDDEEEEREENKAVSNK
jgi:hypothetical protein